MPESAKMHDVDAGRARQTPIGAHEVMETWSWRVPGLHVAAVGGSRGALEWGAVSVVNLTARAEAPAHPTRKVHISTMRDFSHPSKVISP